MKKTFLTVIFCVHIIAGIAQTAGISFSAYPFDELTQKPVSEVRVSLLDSDSALVDTFSCTTIPIPGNTQYLHSCELQAAHIPSVYIVRFERKGYETVCLPVEVKAENLKDGAASVKLGRVELPRAYKCLKEATVKASKIMMVMKGDTLVYNADAFQLAEGSMLDELIAQLPGVKLESGGRITVNGHYVSSLLVNGKDFFNGDPNVALANLPAYMVNKVKAYQRTPDDAYLTRPDSAQKQADDPWVIDVALKRQYAQGWIANAEAGYGTDDRYLARLFALRFTDHSHLAAYASANNLNRTGSPSADSGNWADENTSRGLLTRKQGGIDFRLEPKGTDTKFSTSLTASRTSTDLQSFTSATSFLPDGDAYSETRSLSDNKITQVNWNGSVIQRHSSYYLNFGANASYSQSTLDGNSLQAQWNVRPFEAYRGASLDSCFTDLADLSSINALTNTVSDLSWSETKSWQLNGSLTFDIKMPKSNKALRIISWINYNNFKDNTASHYILRTYTPITDEDARNRYDRMPKRHYDFSTLAGYPLIEASRKGATHKVSLNYEYKQSFDSGSRTLYRLEQLGGRWAQIEDMPLGVLPSTTDSLTLATDWQNTYHTTQRSQKHNGQLQWYYKKSKMQVNLSLSALWGKDRVHDWRTQTFRQRSRHTFSLKPNIDATYGNFRFIASTQREYPSQLLLLNTRDDSNPLATYLGNPDLKPTDYYYAILNWHGTKTAVQRNWSLTLNYTHILNAVGQTRQYVRSTGGYIYTPCNINGNRRATATFSFSQAIDGQHRWQFSSDTKLNYDRSADFSLYAADEEEAQRSVVHNFDYTQSFGIDFRKRQIHAGLKASADWGYAASSRQNFATINTVDMLYRLTLHAPIAWSIVADTDLNLFARTGYSNASMNTTEWVWNASLSRTLDRRKSLTLKLSAHDILGQMTNVRRSINTQGRTETWTNTLTRYLMIHLTYRFSKKPKPHSVE